MVKAVQLDANQPAFRVFGDAARSPVVLSVPHAGRDYPNALINNLRVPVDRLQRLEDRFADRLVSGLGSHGGHIQIATAPRALIDLNRDEREIDPAMVRDLPRGTALLMSAKVRGGLGLVPRFLPYCGDLWRTPLSYAELTSRISTVHRPYHDMIAYALATAREKFGSAVLLDVHSMPSLPLAADGSRIDIVVGDRFGRSASARLTDEVTAIAHANGLRCATNAPYPGSYMLDRHGRPDQRCHAIQIEVDRALYVDASGCSTHGGLTRVETFVADLVAGIEFALAGPALPVAAE